jgi:ABC-type antimicrobial peptide transport system permease subunit
MMRGRGDFKMALASIRAARWRSMLTMLGIIFGVVSVVTVVGIGEGVKQQIGQDANQFGKDLITVRPGSNVASSNALGTLKSTDLLFGMNSTNGLSEQDEQTVQNASHIALAAPLGVVPGIVKVGNDTVKNTTVIATNSELPGALNQAIQYGNFFNSDQSGQNIAVMGQSLAERMFGEFVPLGHEFTFRGQTFMLGGIFSNFNNSPLSPTATFNNDIFVPYQAADSITGTSTEMYAILAKPDNPSDMSVAIRSINAALLATHGGQKDFSVLTPSQEISSSNQALNLLSDLITAVAIVSLFLGGVGIMNVMLVSVTERTHEIGVRKAIGATSQQILKQFMLEALVLSVGGALLGIIVALAADWLLRIYSSLQPAISVWAIVLSTAVSILVGVIFGVAPAVKAARKDPIEALRRE